MYARPVDGSAPSATALRLPHPAFEDDIVTLAGSAQRVAAVVEAADIDYETNQTFSGPGSGPLTALGPPVDVKRDDAFFTLYPLVDGERWVFVATDQKFERSRTTLREGDGPPVELSLPGLAIGLAGDLVAYTTDSGIAIRNWRTGAERSVAVPEDLFSADLRADGALVVSAQSGGVRLISPDGASRRLSRAGNHPRFAGERVVFQEDDGLMIAEPDGRVRAFGPRTAMLGEFDADEHHVVWSANRCVLAADVTERASTAPPAGPCARTEVRIEDDVATLRRDGTLPVTVRCLAAVRTCRGTLRLSFHSRASRVTQGSTTTVRFAIPVGEHRRLELRLGATGVRRARHSGWGKEVPFIARLVTVDPEGRRTSFHDGVFTRVR